MKSPLVRSNALSKLSRIFPSSLVVGLFNDPGTLIHISECAIGTVGAARRLRRPSCAVRACDGKAGSDAYGYIGQDHCGAQSEPVAHAAATAGFAEIHGWKNS